MRVLIVGGTRYFGRMVAERLVAAGHEVTVFSRGNVRPALLERVRHVAGDRADRASFEARFADERFDAVLDNLAFTREDVESAIRAFGGRVGQYVLTSSAAVYDEAQNPGGLRPYREEDVDLEYVPPGYDGSDPTAAYAVGKRQAELALHRAGRGAFAWTVVRPPAVLGPEDYTLRTWWYVQRVLDGGPLLFPAWYRSLLARHVYGPDLADGIVRLIGNPVAHGRTYNLAQEELLTPEELARGFARAAGRELRIAWASKRALEAAGLGDFAAPVAWRLVSDVCAARRDLGWSPTPFEEWAARTVEWHRATELPPSRGYERRAREVELAERIGADG